MYYSISKYGLKTAPFRLPLYANMSLFIFKTMQTACLGTELKYALEVNTKRFTKTILHLHLAVLLRVKGQHETKSNLSQQLMAWPSNFILQNSLHWQ